MKNKFIPKDMLELLDERISFTQTVLDYCNTPPFNSEKRLAESNATKVLIDLNYCRKLHIAMQDNPDQNTRDSYRSLCFKIFQKIAWEIKLQTHKTIPGLENEPFPTNEEAWLPQETKDYFKLLVPALEKILAHTQKV